MVGYDKVLKTARAVGLNEETLKATPAIALGSYVVTPLEIASAYTVFPNGGQLLQSSFIKSISRPRFALALSEPIAADTGARPAPDVPGRKHDGRSASHGDGGIRSAAKRLYASGGRQDWHGARTDEFAGFTSKLICIVWVGFDDYRDFKLEGAYSALPIWVEFMKRAHQHRGKYRNVHAFTPPDGIVTVEIDSDTGERATRACPNVRGRVLHLGLGAGADLPSSRQQPHAGRVVGAGATGG